MSTQRQSWACAAPDTSAVHQRLLCLSSGLRIPFFILMNREESSPQKYVISKKFSLYSHLTVLPFGSDHK